MHRLNPSAQSRVEAVSRLHPLRHMPDEWLTASSANVAHAVGI